MLHNHKRKSKAENEKVVCYMNVRASIDKATYTERPGLVAI